MHPGGVTGGIQVRNQESRLLANRQLQKVPHSSFPTVMCPRPKANIEIAHRVVPAVPYTIAWTLPLIPQT